MRLQILSDLHLEFFSGDDLRGQLPPVVPGVDVLVLSGDITKHARALDIAAAAPLPTVLIAGNHEWYGGNLDVSGQARAPLRQGNAIFLENGTVEIGAVRFLGATLWTDYALFGNPVLHGEHAGQTMTDHRRIRAPVRQPNGKITYGRFRPAQAKRLHAASRACLMRELNRDWPGKTVVVTHHLPSLHSVPVRLREDLLSAAYASRLDDLVALADLWIHGHSHQSADYRIGKCRILCNPRGYPVGEHGFENERFSADLVVEV